MAMKMIMVTPSTVGITSMRRLARYLRTLKTPYAM
jgi:hypothetical protein